MKLQKWAITLCCDDEEKLELRVANLVQYLAQNNQPNQWIVSDIDATGNCGDQLTSRCNHEGLLYLPSTEFLTVFREDGQVIDLEATLAQNDRELFKILVQDGVSIDVLGFGDLPPLTVLGKYVSVDVALFMW
ncbi:MAG TPA: hypothetical protein DD379_27510 [Cyanobacteria bacterium UBA11162]|nr:hypothetical protein [Cyanobacteria bacterium UBA11162]